MNLAALIALLSLALTDPTGDAIGDGTLNPPTSPIYANSALFDLQAVELEVSESGEALLKVTMGALSAAARQPAPAGGEDAAQRSAADGDAAPPAPAAGVADEQADAAREPELEPFDVSGMLAVIDVYLDTAPGGATRTLSGPDMLMPLGVGWDHAVRISAAGAQAITYVGSGGVTPDPSAARLPSAEPVTVPVEPAQSEGPEEAASPAADGADGAEPEPGAAQDAPPAPEELVYVPLAVERRGNVMEIRLPWSLDPEASIDLYAMSGVHDPFSSDGWRRLSEASSPWAFSGSSQVTPVVDLLTPDAETQADALRRGVLPLPPREAGMSLPLSPWLWMMIGGVALALIGLVLRGRVTRQPDAEPRDRPAEEPEERPADEPGDAPRPADAPSEAPTEAPSEEPEDAPVEEPREKPEDAPVEEPTSVPLEDDPRELPVPSHDPSEPPPVEEPAEVPTEQLPPDPKATPGDEAPREAREPRAFSTSADESFLTVEPEAGFGDGAVEGDESFWHPGSRGRGAVTPAEPEES